jgi:hypothetical protein
VYRTFRRLREARDRFSVLARSFGPAVVPTEDAHDRPGTHRPACGPGVGRERLLFTGDNFSRTDVEAA